MRTSYFSNLFVRAATALAMSLVVASCSGSTPIAEQVTTTETPQITAEPLPEIDEAPNAPVGLVVVNTSNGAIELAWDRSRDGTVDEYEISRVSPAGATKRFTIGAPSFVDTGLDDGQIFTYQVVAIGPGGKSEGTQGVTAQVGVDSNAPKRPGRPNIIESDEGVTLKWNPVTDISGIEKYMVNRTVGGETTQIDNGTETTFADDIDSGVVVTYSVSAIDRAGNTSNSSRAVTLLTGTASDRVVIVVSGEADPQNTPATKRFQQELLTAGFTLTWFEDDAFDSNITSPDDVVLLLGDVKGEGFDWNIFGTDSTVVGMKSMFVEAAGITENPPKLDRLAQLDYVPPGRDGREVFFTTTSRPKPVVYIPVAEQLPSLEVWARPVWSDDIAVAGLIPTGGELANEKPAPGCRAFFPGNANSLAEQTNEGWELLVDFVTDITAACS